MAYARDLRKPGDRIRLGETEYRILDVQGCGGSTVVYQAAYPDRLNTERAHKVLIKELYPYHPKGGVYRDGAGCIRYTPDAEELMAYSRLRFKQGNQANLELLEKFPAQMSGNLNSYEAYGTYYSVLTLHGGESLQERLEGERKGTLREIAALMEKIADAAGYFHQNGLLHLDISPDNILLLPNQAMLIDYNSTWSMEGESGRFIFSEKEGYTAPEILLQEEHEVSCAADIYSVCAVFYRMLTGERLSKEDMIGNRLKKNLRSSLEVFQDEPGSAVQKAVQIVRKGLHILPRKRYQSIPELKAELQELICRIDGRGVSHCALWESSRRLYKRADVSGEKYLPQRIILLQKRAELTQKTGGFEKGDISAEDVYDRLKAGESILLKGPGGMGKTRLLQEIWKMGVEEYRQDSPVAYYISLRNYQEMPEESRYIHRYMIRWLCFSKNHRHVEDALHELESIFDRKSEQGVNVILLLDGLNEAGSRRGKLLKEIEELGSCCGVGILVTERSDEVQEYGLRAFQAAELLPLEDEAAAGRLREAGIPVPAGENVKELLRNPMMLELYLQTAVMEIEDSGAALSPEGIHSADDLVGMYLSQLLTHQLWVDAGDEAAQLCHRFILRHLLPEISWEMKRRKASILTLDALYEAVEHNFINLQRKEFGKCFTEYLGKARIMLKDIRDESQWFDYCITEQLVGVLGLLVKDGQGYYRLIHDNFQDYLTEAFRKNRKTYVKKNRGRWKKQVFVLAAAACLTVGTFYMAIQKRAADGVYTEEQQFVMDRAAACLQANVGTLSSQITVQREVLEEAGRSGVAENNPKDKKELKELIDRKLGFAEHLITVNLEPELAGKLLEINPDFPMEQLTSLCGRTKEMESFLEKGLVRLEEILCSGDSVYRDTEVRKDLVEAYKEYLDAYTSCIFYEFDYVLLHMKPDEAGKILDDNRYTAIFKDYFKTVGVGQQDISRVKAAMDKAAEDLKRARGKLAEQITDIGI